MVAFVPLGPWVYATHLPPQPGIKFTFLFHSSGLPVFPNFRTNKLFVKLFIGLNLIENPGCQELGIKKLIIFFCAAIAEMAKIHKIVIVEIYGIIIIDKGNIRRAF